MPDQSQNSSQKVLGKRFWPRRFDIADWLEKKTATGRSAIEVVLVAASLPTLTG